MNRAPINANNFIRWYQNTATTLANSTYSNGIHNGYLLRWREQADYLPVLVGDTLTFYTNFNSDAFLSGNSIKVVTEDSCGSYTVVNDATRYDIDSESWGTNNAKITFTIPVTNTDNDRRVRMAIVDGTDTVLYISNYLLIRQVTEKNINNTHLFTFYHNSDIYDYNWSNYVVATDTPYTVRLASSKIGISYPQEKEIYQEATTGRPRVTRAINNKQVNLEIYYNIEELHDAIATFSSFKSMEINGDPYIVEEIEPEYQRNLNIFKTTLTIKDVNFSRRVNVCNVTIPS